MKRVGFLLQVKPDKIAEYKAHHQTVWPEMLDALRRTGWHNYSLFMRDDGLLFGYFETPESFQAALAGMSQEDINKKWQDLMAPLFRELEWDPCRCEYARIRRGVPPRMTPADSRPATPCYGGI